MVHLVQQPIDSDRGMRREASRRTARRMLHGAAALIACLVLAAPAAHATGPTPTPNPVDVIRVKLLEVILEGQRQKRIGRLKGRSASFRRWSLRRSHAPR